MSDIDNNNYFIHPTSILDENVKIGQDTKIWHFSHILGNTTIGKKCNLGQNVVVGPDVVIGDRCKIQNNVSLYKGITLEDEVFCGPSMVFTNVFNPRSHIAKMDELRLTLVKKGASLGANSTIVCGVTIGRYAFVGAGAVVTKDVPDHALVMGNPARQTGWVCECGEKLNSAFKCPVCGKILNPPRSSAIAFVDLAAQQKKILPEIEKRIKTVLAHGKYIMGPEVTELENKLADFVKVKHAISCSSGTDALLMSLMACGAGPGDAVFTTPFTFVATAEVIKLLGATPVFVDIDQADFNMSAQLFASAVEKIAKEGALIPKAVIPVDLFGLPCNYDQITRTALKYNMTVIEDAAQSFGAEYNDQMAGSLGHIGCTSFFPAKPLGGYGDGGAIFTNSDEIADTLLSIRIHGKGTDKYENVRLGINGRLDTLQAAILLTKFEIFPEELQARRQIAASYRKLLSSEKKSLKLPQTFPGSQSAWAQYSLLAPDRQKREIILNHLEKNNIPAAVYYPRPLHLQSVFMDLRYDRGSFPVAEDCSDRIFSLPMHPYLRHDDLKQICDVVRSALLGR